MATIQLSYLKLLEEIGNELGIETLCGVRLVGGGLFLACIELTFVHIESGIETQRCWGGPYANMHEATEEAGYFAVHRIKSKFGLEIKDVNYEDYILYKNMYHEVIIQYGNLLGDFNNLKNAYNALETSSASAIAQNAKFVVEHAEMRSRIDEYRSTINFLRRGCSVSSADPSEDSSGF